MTKGLIALLAGAVLMGGCFPGAEWAADLERQGLRTTR